MAASHSDTPDESPEEGDNGKPGFWTRRVVLPIKKQLYQGATRKEITWAVVAALIIGIFPILGTTSLVGGVVGHVFKLNQVVIHSLGLMMAPLHILLILPFIRAGEWLFRADPISFSIPDMLALFFESPPEFFSEYGMSCVHCICAWGLAAPLLAAILYPIIKPIIGKFPEKKPT